MCSVVNAFTKIISEKRKPNKMWVDQGSEFYNNFFRNFLKINNIKVYSTYKEGKSVVAEKIVRSLKKKTFKHVTSIQTNIYFDVLDDIINKYNNTVHRTIKMKPIEITDDYYVKSKEDFNKKDPKFKVSDHVRISKYTVISAKGYTLNWSEEVFAINKIKNTVSWTYVINDLNVEEIIGSFCEKELKKINQKEFRIEKVPLKR